MDGADVAALQGGGDAMLASERITQGVPSVMDAFHLQLQAQSMDEVIGQHADAQMAFDPVLGKF